MPHPGDQTKASQPRPSAWSILSVRLRFVALLLALVVVAASWNHVEVRVGRLLHGKDPSPATADEYFCPMHAAVVRDDAGKCPSCGMPLSRRKRAAGPSATGAGRIQLSPLRIQQAGIRVSTVEWRALELEVDAPGFIRFDETRIARVTARFAGRIDALEANATGATIEKGKALATIYSKDVTNAVALYLVALKDLREAEARSATAAIQRLQSTVNASRRQFALWGFSSEQIDEIDQAGQAPASFEIRAPFSGVVTHREVVVGDYVTEGTPLFHVADLSSVWLVARVATDDLPFVTRGRRLVAMDTGVPARSFEGPVTYVAPFIDEATQTADVRAELPNPEGLLRPGTYVTAMLRVPIAELEPFRASSKHETESGARVVYHCPMHAEVVRNEPGICEPCGGMKLVRDELPASEQGHVLCVPESAVVDTGPLQVVYVESDPGVFEAREVKLGPRCGDHFPVVSGLAAGTRVATAGSFLLDAETRLNPSAASTYFGASGTPDAASATKR